MPIVQHDLEPQFVRIRDDKDAGGRGRQYSARSAILQKYPDVHPSLRRRSSSDPASCSNAASIPKTMKGTRWCESC
jgi:hypothetical protein